MQPLPACKRGKRRGSYTDADFQQEPCVKDGVVNMRHGFAPGDAFKCE